MIPGKGKIKIESGSDGLIVGSFDENNQILDTHSFGQGYITESAFTYDAFTGGPIMVTVQNEDGSFSQDGYLKIVRINGNKVGCVFPMVVFSILQHAEFGPNDHREDASHFNLCSRATIQFAAPFVKITT